MSQRFWLRQLGFLTVLAALTLVLTGCGGSKLTKENADKITKDMPEAKVKEILGEPTKVFDGKLEVEGLKMEAPGQKFFFYEGGGKQLVVTLKDGKVLGTTPTKGF